MPNDPREQSIALVRQDHRRKRRQNHRQDERQVLPDEDGGALLRVHPGFNGGHALGHVLHIQTR